MKCPKCNNDRFYAHQVLHTGVIVDENNNWESGGEGQDIYHADPPFGPYTCTKCENEIDSLEER